MGFLPLTDPTQTVVVVDLSTATLDLVLLVSVITGHLLTSLLWFLLLQKSSTKLEKLTAVLKSRLRASLVSSAKVWTTLLNFPDRRFQATVAGMVQFWELSHLFK